MRDVNASGPSAAGGEWVVAMTCDRATDIMRMTITVDGDRVAAHVGPFAFEGNVAGSLLELQTPAGTSPRAIMTGAIGPDLLTGDYIVGRTCWTWSATRPAPPRSGESRTWAFAPIEFHRVFSGAIEPVLRVASGDRITTWTIDSSGFDAAGIRRSRPGNPQTGPFYVEGAIPGDALAVTITRLVLNRDTAVSRRCLWREATTPQYFAHSPAVPNPDTPWVLDRHRGVARLAHPPAALRQYEVPLRPMLGCVAVAPPDGMAFTSQYPGTFGGNLDYVGIREGVTLYLPVYQSGALLFIGDGHAAQGDGEVTVSALETSMDVELAVRVISGRAPTTPCAEDSERIMAIGVGRVLNEALQIATSALASWLERDYGLCTEETATVLGTALRYDIAQVVNPCVTVVASLSKAVLARIDPSASNGERP
jgi:amidase